MEYKSFRIEDLAGNAVPGATVNVYLTGTTTHATGLQDFAGGAVTSPFTADAVTGKVGFRAPNGTYDIVMVRGDFQDALYGTEFFDIEDANIDRSGRYDSVQALLDSTDPARGEGKVWQGGARLFTEAAVGAFDYHEVTAGGVGLYEAGDRFTSRPRAESGDTLGSDMIHIGDLAFGLDPSGTALTTGDGRTWKPSRTATPEHFGAAGNGTSDDTAAINACLAAFPTQTVGRRGAVYRCTSSIRYPDGSNVDWRGATFKRGWRTINDDNHALFKHATLNCNDITIKNYRMIDDGTQATRGAGHYFIGSNITLRNFKVRFTSAYSDLDPVGANACGVSGTNILIEHADIDNYVCGRWSDGIHPFGGGGNITIRDCTIRSGDDSLGLAHRPGAWPERGADSACDGVFIQNVRAASQMANILRIGAEEDSNPAQIWRNVNVQGLVQLENRSGGGRAITFEDKRAGLPAKNGHIQVAADVQDYGIAGVIGCFGNADVTNVANIAVKNFSTILLNVSARMDNDTGTFFYGGGADEVVIEGRWDRVVGGIVTTEAQFFQIGRLQFRNHTFLPKTTGVAALLTHIGTAEWLNPYWFGPGTAAAALIRSNTSAAVTQNLYFKDGQVSGAATLVQINGSDSYGTVVVLQTDFARYTNRIGSYTAAGSNIKYARDMLV